MHETGLQCVCTATTIASGYPTRCRSIGDGVTETADWFRKAVEMVSLQCSKLVITIVEMTVL